MGTQPFISAQEMVTWVYHPLHFSCFLSGSYMWTFFILLWSLSVYTVIYKINPFNKVRSACRMIRIRIWSGVESGLGLDSRLSKYQENVCLCWERVRGGGHIDPKWRQLDSLISAGPLATPWSNPGQSPWQPESVCVYMKPCLGRCWGWGGMSTELSL